MSLTVIMGLLMSIVSLAFWNSFRSTSNIVTERYKEKDILTLFRMKNIEGKGTEEKPFIIQALSIFPEDVNVIYFSNITHFIQFKSCGFKTLKLRDCANFIFEHCEFLKFVDLKRSDAITFNKCTFKGLELNTCAKVIINESKILTLNIYYSFLNEFNKCKASRIFKHHSPDNILDIEGVIEDKSKKSNVFVNYYPAITIVLLITIIAGNVLLYFLLTGFVNLFSILVPALLIPVLIFFIGLLFRDKKILYKKVRHYYQDKKVLFVDKKKLLLGFILILFSIAIIDTIFIPTLYNVFRWNSLIEQIILIFLISISSFLVPYGVVIFLKNSSIIREKFFEKYNPLYPYFLVFNIYFLSFLTYLEIGSLLGILNGFYYILAPILLALLIISSVLSIITLFRIKSVKNLPNKEKKVFNFKFILGILLLAISFISLPLNISIFPKYIFSDGFFSYPLEAILEVLIFCLIFLLLILGILNPSTSSKDKLKRRYTEIKRYQSLLAREPNNDILWSNLGYTHYEKGELYKALDVFKKALEINEDSKAALLGISLVYAEMEDFESALESCNRAFKTKAKLKIATTTIEAIQQSLSKPIGDDVIWYCLSYIYLKKGEYEQAVSSAKKALEIEPKSERTWIILAVIYNRFDEYDKAIDATEKALEINNKSELAWGQMGYAFHKKGSVETAFKLLNDALFLKPKSPEIWYISAKIHLEMKNYDKALEAINISLNYKPHYKEAQKLREEINNLRTKSTNNTARND